MRHNEGERDEFWHHSLAIREAVMVIICSDTFFFARSRLSSNIAAVGRQLDNERIIERITRRRWITQSCMYGGANEHAHNVCIWTDGEVNSIW